MPWALLQKRGQAILKATYVLTYSGKDHCGHHVDVTYIGKRRVEAERVFQVSNDFPVDSNESGECESIWNSFCI